MFFHPGDSDDLYVGGTDFVLQIDVQNCRIIEVRLSYIILYLLFFDRHTSIHPSRHKPTALIANYNNFNYLLACVVSLTVSTETFNGCNLISNLLCEVDLHKVGMKETSAYVMKAIGHQRHHDAVNVSSCCL